jgi:transposase
MRDHSPMNAYSEDLRKKKIVEALGRGATKSEAARTFGVSRSSVKRYAKRADEGRPLAPRKRPGLKPKLDQGARRLLEKDLEERPAKGPRRPCASGASSCERRPGSRSASRP